MIKGIALSTSIAVFVASLIIAIAGFSNILKENLITGAAIGAKQLAAYSLIPLILSFITTLLIIKTIKQ
tara:strand:- start:592 stop:798 length:207 start_codon:yes stop_codon:yes gene_type:complete